MKRVLQPIATVLIAPYRWRLMESFEYRLGSDDGSEFVRVLKGFETDFASVPRPLWVLWPPTGGTYTAAVLVHDCLYKTGYVHCNDGTIRPIDRQEADDICKEVMEVCGVNWFSKRAIYRGIRLGGRRAWNKHRKAEHVDLEKAG